MELSSLFLIQASIMNLLGGFILILSFLGKRYQGLLDESNSRYDCNPPVFKSLVDQKASAIVGFSLMVIGFIEQIISYIPYNTLLSSTEVIYILSSINIFCIGVLLLFRWLMFNFYIGLFLINLNYIDAETIPNQYIKQIINTNGFSCSGCGLTRELEKAVRRKPKLYLNLVKFGKRTW